MQILKKHPFFLYIAQVGIVAGSYFIFGLLGLALAVPPSNAGAVWPPAGISLAAVLLLGKRIWPGIFIGNFCISAWAFGFYNAPIIVYLATACGATLNALVGSSLIHRLVGFPNKLIEDKAIISFLLLGGPLSCLLPATIGLTSMALTGIISMDEIPVNWFSWWVGDTIGVLVFTPLILIIFGKPKKLWRQRTLSVGVPLALSFLMVVFFFVYASKLEQEKLQQDFNNLSVSLSQALVNRIQSHLHIVYSLKSFFSGSYYVEQSEFSLFSKRPLSLFNELESISWLEKIKNEEKQTQYALLFSEGKNEDSDQAFILKSLNKNVFEDQVTDHAENVSLLIGRDHLYFYLPVHLQGPPVADHVLDMSGMIVSSISIKSLLSETFQGLDTEEMLLTIFAQNKSGDHTVVYSGINDQNLPSIYPQFLYKHQFKIGDDIWLLEILPSTAFVSSRYHWTIWFVLIGGLLFTCLLGTGLLLITGRYFRTEAIVRERTEELRNEIKVRKLAEHDQKTAMLKAESASHAKSLFLSNISHELRTPLNGILGFTQFLKKDRSISKNNQEMVDIISHCGDYLLTLINDILDISKIESNKIIIESEAFDFLSLIHDIVEIFKLSTDQKNIRFVANIPDSIPKIVIGDEKRLRQIVVNLLSNAVKYTDQGEIIVNLSYQNEIIKISISDTGCGISSEHIGKIFKPFTQIEKTVGADEGTGLGLAITSQLIDLMEGNITVESKPGYGSTFTISLPLPQSAIQTNPVSSQKKIIGYEGGSRSILIVDDNAENLGFLRKLLQDLRFVVSIVNEGRQCLGYCSSIVPDLVFMDMMMPEMDGMETTRKLIEINPLYSQRVIGMSASVFTEEKQKFLEAGCIGFISKPIKQEELLSNIESRLNLQWVYASPKETVASQSNKILIADDNEINCLLLKNMLELHGFQIDVTYKGDKALDLMLKQPYHSALVDLNMPTLNGIEVVRAVRSSKGPNQRLQMAAISAYAEQEKVAAALDSGFNEYLVKPIDEMHLRKFLFEDRHQPFEATEHAALIEKGK